MKKILVDYGSKRHLANIFRVSEVTVRSALAHRTKSVLSNRIRKRALQLKTSAQEKKILVEQGEKRRLAELFGVSDVSVRSALFFRTRSPLSDRIRKAALERGGRIMEKSNLK